MMIIDKSAAPIMIATIDFCMSTIEEK